MRLEKNNPAPVTLKEVIDLLEAAVPDGTHYEVLMSALGKVMQQVIRCHQNEHDTAFMAKVIVSVLARHNDPLNCASLLRIAAEYVAITAVRSIKPEETVRVAEYVYRRTVEEAVREFQARESNGEPS